MKKINAIIIITLFLVTLLSCSQGEKSKKAPKKAPKNIILMISDGCGFNHVIASNYYQYGKKQAQPYEQFPVNTAMSTYPAKLSQEQWAFGYNPDSIWKSLEFARKGYTGSAAAATAMATGTKTYNGAIGVDINKKKLPNLVEWAEKMKKSTGVITSVPLSHATPAGFVAHNEQRHQYDEIAKEMILQSQCEVIMGGGNPYYGNNGEKLDKAKTFKYVGDSVIWHDILVDGKNYIIRENDTIFVNDADHDGKPDAWKLIQDKEDFKRLTTGETPKRLFGVPKVAKTLQQMRKTVENEKLPFDAPLNENIPSLSDMSKAAINVLDNKQDGFFLMIEGGAVDWASHANQSNRMIEEQMDFNKAVESVIHWIENNSSWEETMLIITADHECGLLLGSNSTDTNYADIVNNGKDNLPGMQWYHDSHSNTLVPFYAKGKGTELIHLLADETDPVRGKYITNSEIAILVKLLWNNK